MNFVFMIDLLLVILCTFASETFGHHRFFISELNITNGSPLIMGYSDRLYYFTKPCQDSEISMGYAGDDNTWRTTKELKFANKTFPAFVTYDDEIHFDDDDDLLVYSMIMAVNGNLFQYDPNSQTWKPYTDVGRTDKLEYEGSATFFNYKDGYWYSPSKTNTLYISSPNEWQFNTTNENILDINVKIKDVELFPLVDKVERKSKNEKWVLLILRECGLVEYYIGEITNSKFNKLAGPHEFMKAENINDLAVIDRDRLTVFFNTYLRKSTKDCTPGDWNAVIPQRKQIQLSQPTINKYRLFTQFNIIPSNAPHVVLSENSFKLTTERSWSKYGSSNLYMETSFQITAETKEIGLVIRQDPQTDDGVTIGLNLENKAYYYHKRKNATENQAEYRECECTVSQNVPVTYDVSEKSEFPLTVLADGPLVEAIYFDSFIFAFLEFSEHINNKITVYSKGPSTVSISSYVYQCFPMDVQRQVSVGRPLIGQVVGLLPGLLQNLLGRDINSIEPSYSSQR